MNKKSLLRSAVAGGLMLASIGQASAAGVYITEWMYKGNGGEFIEFTNLSDSAVNFAGWSYDDDSRIVGAFSLSAFGVVAAGESVIITEDSASKFRADWNLDASVKVIGGYTNNLGNGDEINLFNALGTLADRLTYGTNPRTDGTSGTPASLTALGLNDVSQWIFSSIGDRDGAYLSANIDLGSPGKFNAGVSEVPVPAAAWLFGSALVGLFGAKRRKA